jgi:hypothetical protein
MAAIRAACCCGSATPGTSTTRCCRACSSRSRPASTSNGLGLGLYIVDQFVRAHGGRIGARNEAGQVVFEATLPGAESPARRVAESFSKRARKTGSSATATVRSPLPRKHHAARHRLRQPGAAGALRRRLQALVEDAARFNKMAG